MRSEGESATPSLTSAEEDALQHKDHQLRVEVLPGGACIEPLVRPDSSFISGRCRWPLSGRMSGISSLTLIGCWAL